MHNRRAYSQTEVQVAVLRSTDSATARRVKELVLEMVRVEPGDRPSAEYVHHTLDLMTQVRRRSLQSGMEGEGSSHVPFVLSCFR